MGTAIRALVEALVDASPDAIVLVDGSGTIEYASPSTATLFGWEPDELVGRPVEVLIPVAGRGDHSVLRRRYMDRPSARAMGTGLDLSGQRRDGTTFPVDVSLAPMEVDGRVGVGAFVRDATQRRRSERLQRAVSEISQLQLADATNRNVLDAAADLVVSIGDADGAMILVPGSGRWRVVGSAASPDTVPASLVDRLDFLPDAAQIAEACATRRPVGVAAFDDLLEGPRPAATGFGAAICVPFDLPSGEVGCFVATRTTGKAPFSRYGAEAFAAFGGSLALVMSLGESRREVEYLRLVSDRERIARDLHDTVIQRLFAAGLTLQSAQRLLEGPAARRIEDAVDEIDSVIREIRATIFELNRPEGSDPDLRAMLEDVVRRSQGALGFVPEVEVSGSLEHAVSAELAADLAAVVGEALSNVARHAAALRASVSLTVGGDGIELEVRDDGRGTGGAHDAGRGISNLAERASRYGGRCTLSDAPGGGAVLRWTIPVER